MLLIFSGSPSAKTSVASYGLGFARKHSEDCRRIITARWYREIFPETVLACKGHTSEEIRTTIGGSRKAVSIGSSFAGHGADYIIIGDLLRVGDALSGNPLLDELLRDGRRQ